MTQSSQENLLDHEYDGIREFDNPTPWWWHLIFIASVIFAVVYLAFFHMSDLSWTPEDRWARAQTAEFRRIFGAIGEMEPDDATFLRMMDESRMMAVARSIFEANCTACHGRTGSGISGPNLTDDHWINVTTVPDIFDVITKGAASGAMPSWERLSQNERIILTAYVATLRDNPVPGRAAEGTAIPPWSGRERRN